MMSTWSVTTISPQTRAYLTRIRESAWLSVGCGIVFVFFVFLLRQFFIQFVHSDVPFIFSLIAVMLSSMIGGIVAGSLSLLLSFLIETFFFIEPFNTFKIFSRQELINAIFYLIEGTALTLIIENLHMSRQNEIDRSHKLVIRELQLETANHKILSILESISDAFFTVDKSWRFTYINSRAEQMFRRNKATLLGKSLWVTLPRIVGTQFEQGYRQARKTKQVVNFESYFEPFDRWYAVHAYPSREGLSVYFDDITDRKKAEISLKETETKMMMLANSPLIGITFSRIDGSIEYANDAYLQITGYTREEFANKEITWTQLTPPEWIQKDREAVEEARLHGSCTPYEKEYIRKDGKRIPIIIGFLVYGKNNDLYIAFVMDISKRKELERQKDEFLSIVSHELKSPITNIKGLTQFLERKCLKNGDTQTAEILHKMDVQSNKLTQFVNELLDGARLQSGRMQFHFESFNFDELIIENVKEMQLSTQHHQIEIKGKTNCIVTGDKQRTSQVFVNFLSNAIKYSPENSLITVSLQKTPTEAVCNVADQGIGIPDEQKPKIFSRYYRVNRIDNSIPGVGLGLYISAEIIHQLGGRIWFESMSGKGSTFSFSIPQHAIKNHHEK